MSRYVSKRYRRILWHNARGMCQWCGSPLGSRWHVDHITPYVVTNDTNLCDLQALCQTCNLRKGSMILRKHQAELLKLLNETDVSNLLRKRQIVSHVWPGGGKSILPIIVGQKLKNLDLIDKIVCVVPRLNLERQLAKDFADESFRKHFRHSLELNQPQKVTGLDCGSDGYIATYQWLKHDVDRLHTDYFRKNRTLLVLDEVHHVAEGSQYHKSLLGMYDRAAFRLLMTGTPDRNDQARIAFLDYKDGYPVMDIKYSLKDALKDRAVIPMRFHYCDGAVEYEEDGDVISAGSLQDDDALKCRKVLWTALNTNYAPQLTEECLLDWQAYRRKKPRSLMLVVCHRKGPARKIHEFLLSKGVQSAIATSDESEAAQETIERFKYQDTPDAPKVLVTVDMAYEGMDVKQITHIALLTYKRSLPWLIQCFGRGTRFDPHPDAGPWSEQRCWIFTPKDSLLLAIIKQIEEEQKLGLKECDIGLDDEDVGNRRDKDGEDRNFVEPRSGELTDISLGGLFDDGHLPPDQRKRIRYWMSQCPDVFQGDELAVAKALSLANLAIDSLPLPPAEQTPFVAGNGETFKERRDRIQRRIVKRLRRIAYHTGKPFRDVQMDSFMGPQGKKPIHMLTVEELKPVDEWSKRLAAKVGLKAGVS